MRNISADDVKLLALAFSGPAVIIVVCLIVKGKERWLFMFGWLFLIVLAVALLKR